MTKWKDIIGYENLYQINNNGKVKSLDRIIIRNDNIRKTIKSRILINTLNPNGYYEVKLSKNGIVKKYWIHRLIAMHFIKNEMNKKEVNHKNGIKTDNSIKNLEWVTPKENMIHAYSFGLNKQFGETHSGSKLSIRVVKEIKKSLLNYKCGMVNDLSKKYNVHYNTISNIRRNIVWKGI
jgi:hypothetical protein